MKRECWVSLCAAALVCALGVALTACGGEGRSSGGWCGTIESLPNGAVVVSNPDEGIWSADEAWTLIQDLRMGSAEGEGPDAFWRIAGFGVAPDGDIFVIDQSEEVRQFRSTGEFVRTLGRQGEGPGEFQDAFGMAFDPDGNAWIADARLKRYSVFSSDGTLQRTVPMTVQTFPTPWEGVFDKEGRLHEASVSVARDWADMTFTSVRLDRAGHIDTVPALEDRVALMKGMPVPNLMVRLAFSFDTAGTAWLGRTDHYRIIQQRLDSGDTLRIVERPLRPLPLTDAEKDSLAKQFAPAGLQPADLPDVRPLFRRIYKGADGALLVQLVTPPSGTESVFDVFDQQGRLLGQLRSSTRLLEGDGEPPPQVHGDCIYGIAKDSLGVHYLLRYRITKPGGAIPSGN